MHRVLVLAPERVSELRRGQERPQDLADVAVGKTERRHAARHECGRRVVAHEIHRELTHDELGARRLLDDPVDRLRELVVAARTQRLTEQPLGPVVVAPRIEQKHAVRAWQLTETRIATGPLRPSEAETGEHVRQRLDIALRVTAVDPERVQLEELAGVVLIDVTLGVLRVVEVLEHRGVLRGREHEVAKVPERVRADRVRLVVGEPEADPRLALENAEVIQPEPDELLVQRVLPVERAQEQPALGLGRRVMTGAAQGVARLALGLVARQLRDLPFLGLHEGEGVGQRTTGRRQVADCRHHLGRQCLSGRGELRDEVGVAAPGPKLGERAAVDAEAQPVEPGEIGRRHRCLRAPAGGRHAGGEREQHRHRRGDARRESRGRWGAAPWHPPGTCLPLPQETPSSRDPPDR